MSDRNIDRTTGMPTTGPSIQDGGEVAAATQAINQAAAAKSAEAAAPPTEPQTGFLNFVTPTEMVDLPSKGKYYPEGHPWHNKEQVEIKFMTAKEEDILTSRTLLKKGIAIDRLIKSVCVDRVDVSGLLSGDKNALMIAARITGYGPEYDVNLACPVCTARNEYTWDLGTVDLMKLDEEWMEKYNVEQTPRGYRIQLPRTKAVVNVRFLTGQDEDKLDKLSQNKKKSNLGESRMTDQFRTMIVDINDHSDPSLIAKFSQNMPAMDAKVLRQSYAKMKPDVDTSLTYICPECGSDTEVEMPMTAQFFWPE